MVMYVIQSKEIKHLHPWNGDRIRTNWSASSPTSSRSLWLQVVLTLFSKMTDLVLISRKTVIAAAIAITTVVTIDYLGSRQNLSLR